MKMYPTQPAEAAEIQALFHRESEIHPDEVRRWMAHPDLDVRGCLFTYLSEPQFACRIVPSLPREEADNFARCYLMELHPRLAINALEISILFHRGSEIHPDEVRRWMPHPDLEVRGCLFGYMSERRFACKIIPSLLSEEVDDFARRYLMECIWADVSAEFDCTTDELRHTDTSYEAAYAICGWLKWLADAGDPEGRLPLWREALGQAYKVGDARVRGVLLNGTIEHVLENRVLRKVFRVWRADPVLRRVYAEGMLWITAGHTPGTPGAQ